MIQKFKDLSKVGEHIDEIKGQVESHNEDVTSMRESFAGLKEEVAELKSIVAKQNEELAGLREIHKEFSEIKESFAKELYDFKIVKSDVQKKIMEKFDKEIHDELAKNFSKIKTDLDTFNKLKSDIELISSKTVKATEEIDKFNKIAKQVKEGDYNLSKYAKELAKADSEKVALLKKIDTLERLVSKQRRSKGKF